MNVFKQLLKDLKSKIKKNNEMFNNIEQEKYNLSTNVNDSLYDRLKNNIQMFNKKNKGLETGKANVELAIDKIKLRMDSIINESAILRASMSGISNTLDKMNNLLNSFGFTDFHFVENDMNTYKVVRSDGSNVGKTLSEGEQRFISFLYFYQLVQGTLDSTGKINDRIIVIDDPISSLDSNILFIVSTLVKNIIDDCLMGTNNIEQVIILTHNVYFMKEITFRPSRAKYKFDSSNTNYFVIQKNNGISYMKSYQSNPISTTYDLLWSEIRDNEKEKHKGTIFNTMRRILEYYFNILGGLDYEKLISSFEGEEKQLCHSLLSCINDSSHYIPDDYNIVITQELIEKYLNVFKLIFEKTNQDNHYRMMMKISN